MIDELANDIKMIGKFYKNIYGKNYKKRCIIELIFLPFIASIILYAVLFLFILFE